MQKNKIKIKKRELSYEIFESKNSDSDTILILHGWQGASSSWTKVGDLLNIAGYNVIIPDIPCASKNTKCNEVFNLDNYAELIEEFIEDLKQKYSNINFDKLILWGHSNGGAISIKLVNRNNLKILRLILNNSAGMRNDKKRSLKRRILNFFTKIIKKIISSLSGEIRGKFKKLRVLFYRAIGSQDYLKAEKNLNLKQTYLNMISSDLNDEIKKIENHTLLIWGENDTYTPVSDAHYMRENIKNSKLIVLDNETHGIHLKNPRRLVETFLQNI